MLINKHFFRLLCVLFLLAANFGLIAQNTDSDSLLRAKFDQLESEIKRIQYQYYNMQTQLEKQTKKMLRRTDSGIDVLLLETKAIRTEMAKTSNEEANKIQQLNEQLSTLQNQNLKANTWHYIFASLILILLGTIIFLLFYLRKQSVRYLANKADKIFDDQSDIKAKTYDMLNLHQEVIEAIQMQQKTLKKQQKATGKAAKEAIRGVVKKKYRKK